MTRVRTKRTDTRWSEAAVPWQYKQTQLHGTAPGRPAARPPLHLTLCMRQQSERDLQPSFQMQIVH